MKKFDKFEDLDKHNSLDETSKDEDWSVFQKDEDSYDDGMNNNSHLEDENAFQYDEELNIKLTPKIKDDDKMSYDNNKQKNDKGSIVKKNSAIKFSNDIFKVVGLIVSGLLLVIALWIMTKCFTPAQQRENVILSYNTSNQVDYRVFLVNNNFYETNILGPGDIVPVAFIDRIELDFSSLLSTNRNIDMNYTYKVTGVITATADDNSNDANGGNKIWTKSYEFIAPRSLIESATTGYNIMESIPIDYNAYNELVNQYKMKAGIPMKAALTVTLTVEGNSVVDNQPLNVSESVSVNIPLSVTTVQITTTGDGTKTNSLTNTEEISASKNIVLLIISVIVFIASLLSTLMLLKSLRKMTVEHSLIIKFNKIMKDYNQVIIEIEELPDVKNAAVIEVKTFKDMLDVQKELHLPIMCCKSKDDIITDNIFYIVNQNQIFKYQMNDAVEKI